MSHPNCRPGTPTEAFAELLAGNERFVTGRRIHPHQDAEHRAALAAEQRPFAVVFGCSDSRLAAEIIFDRGLGDLFVVRTAGHIVGDGVMASVEYGVAVLDAPLVVVLGHDSCGAIQAGRAAVAGAVPAGRHLQTIVERVVPSLRSAASNGVTDDEGIAGVHVLRTIDMITSHETALAELVASGACAVVGMSYRLGDGRVRVLGGQGVPAVGPETVGPKIGDRHAQSALLAE